MTGEGVAIKLPQTVTLLTLTCACRSPQWPLFAKIKHSRTHPHPNAVTAYADVPVPTSGNSWAREHICSVPSGNSEGCCCLNSDLPLNIFTSRIRPKYHSSQDRTPAGVPRTHPRHFRQSGLSSSPKGEQMSGQITSFTLFVSPPSLCSCLCGFADFLRAFFLCSRLPYFFFPSTSLSSSPSLHLMSAALSRQLAELP